MTSIEDVATPLPGGDLVAVMPESRFDRFEELLSRISQRLNPILVKEARQALRSKQFVATFLVMLAAGWGWSIMGLAWIGPDVDYGATGPVMFYGYHVILAFPLIVVAPYFAFHSLSSERQDRTHELVAITSLGAGQIISGKLGSVALQVVLYLSAIVPCLAFTYLLRGIDIFTILLAVVYTALMSLGLSAAGLLLATLNPPRQRQISTAVIFAVVLFGCFGVNLSWILGTVVSEGAMIESSDFWIVNLGLLIFYLNAFVLVFLSARSQLMTVNQNRSTALRIALLIAQTSLVAWMVYVQLRFGNAAIFAFVLLATFCWWISGIFLTGEPSQLSPRVKRDLPQSVLARVFLTWFFPGSGTGYLFVLANMLVFTLMTTIPYPELAAVLGLPVPSGPATRVARIEAWEAVLIATSYLAVYLGVGRLLLLAIGRYTPPRLGVRGLVHLLLLMLGSCIPLAIQLSIPEWRNDGYTLLQITNPMWTLWEICTRGMPISGSVLVLTLPAAALLVLALNLPSLVVELRQTRIAKPSRVAEDDVALAGGPAQSARSSPWD